MSDARTTGSPDTNELRQFVDKMQSQVTTDSLDEIMIGLLRRAADEIDRLREVNRGACECSTADACQFVRERDAARAELKREKTDAERWRAFHEDCTCGAASVRTPTGKVQNVTARLAALQAAHARAMEVLRWYGDIRNWDCDECDDQGSRARDSLAELTEGKQETQP